MPTTLEITAYQYNELDERAKSKARHWLRECMNYDFDHERYTEIFRQILENAGLPTDCIEWSLSHCQGDGVAFYGMVDIEKYLEHTRQKTAFRALRQDDAWIVSAEIKRNSFGNHYSHFNTMYVTVSDENIKTHKQEAKRFELEKALSSFIVKTSKALAKQGYNMIEADFSDEVIEENINANEYLFTKEGKRTTIL